MIPAALPTSRSFTESLICLEHVFLIGYPNGTFAAVLVGKVDTNYGVQTTSQLTTNTVWTGFLSITNMNNGVLITDPAAVTNQQRFYRAVMH